MRTLFFLLPLLLISFSTTSLRANSPFKVDAYDLSFKNFSEFAHWLHETMEAGESGDPQSGFFNKIRSKLNFFELARTIRRAGNLMPDPSENGQGASGQYDPREDFKSLVFALVGSHTTETLSSSVYYTVGKMAGVSDEVLLPTTGALATMILPGVADWGCWVVMGTFIGSEEARDLAKSIRIYTVWSGKAAGNFVGLSQLMGTLIEKRPARKSLEDFLEAQRRGKKSKAHRSISLAISLVNPPVIAMATDEAIAHEFLVSDEGGRPLLSLRLDNLGEGALQLRWVKLNIGDFNFPVNGVLGGVPGGGQRRAHLSAARAHLATVLRTFGGEVRQAVLKVFDNHTRRQIDSTLYSPFVMGAEFWDVDSDKPKKRSLRAHAHCEHCTEHDHLPAHLEESEFAIEDATVAPGELKIWFRERAIQFKASRHWHPANAIKAAPGIAADRLSHCAGSLCNGFISAGRGLLWLSDNPGAIFYAPVYAAGKTMAFTVKSGLKLSRISFQVMRSLADAGIQFSRRLESGYDFAAQRVAGIWKRCADFLL